MSSTPTQPDSIVVRGARVHNLKNIDFEVPHNTLTVVTGVSGSGKSSLAFDTIYAEGQRRYVESLSAYARQFLERIEKPDADTIDGIAPAVAIRQKNTTRNPRSTVATATEIYDYLRLLFARVGRTYCANCGREVKKDTVDEVADTILALGPDTRLQVLFPLQRPGLTGQESSTKTEKSSRPRKTPLAPKTGRSGVPVLTDALKTRLFDLRKAGFNRLYQDGQVFEFSTPESLLDVNFSEPVFVLVDRLTVSADARSRVVDAIETAYREAGEVIFEIPKTEDLTDVSVRPTPATLRFAQRFECKSCTIRYEEPEPRLFSFNNPYGACAKCQGFGNTIDFDLDLVIPDKMKSLADGAIEPWTKPKYRPLFTDLKRYAKAAGIPLDMAWIDLAEEHRNLVLNGEGKFLGVRGFFAHLERKKYKLHVRVFLSRYRGYSTCSECNGSRLRMEARQVKIQGRNLCEICALTVEDGLKFFDQVQLSRQEAEIAEKVLDEIRERLKFLNDVGLDYLTLDRLSSTLSGGEAQRIQLATSLGSRLVGTLYVLDEPSIGLHARDTHRLVRILHDLRNLGNTILVVEHDPDIMKAADRILDLGPGAGENGGKLIAGGTFDEIVHNPASLTGRYLSEDLRIQPPATRRHPGTQQIRVRGIRANNLKNVDISIPLGMLVAITGVSGSGKSTLLHQVIYKALSQAKQQAGNGNGAGATTSATWESLDGDQYIEEVVLVDQSPIGRTPRSNPVTYIKAFDAIRELFASLPDAKKRGFSSGHFSFNIPGGRCEVCQGDGTVTVEMQFLADVELVCEECKGTRYKPTVLEVRYRGKNIHEVLNLTVKEALKFFAEAPKVTEKLRSLEEVGLGYLRLGQSATTLSGGEAQRMKLAAHLQPATKDGSRGSNGQKLKRRLLYIFDEPTTGLHFDDVSKLLAAFRRLIEAGGSIVVIEHNLEVIKTADWVIDLGPEGGSRGGKIVGIGPPEAIAKLPGSFTGKYLARVLNGHGASGSNGRS
ncbi:MAG TPA: excinuclease ABC subunit UvrA [Candidatus Sulfotelmatobacter sp.]|nr:excinuclease ABC subunit UvrA [Candidatus Sulfotelmatobacter sp.]